MWHRLSGLPDNVTDEGDVVQGGRARRLQSQKEVLRARVARLRGADYPQRVRTLANLAASYLIAGDVETARRYIGSAEEILAANGPAAGERRAG
jgi:hypothetical protein